MCPTDPQEITLKLIVTKLYSRLRGHLPFLPDMDIAIPKELDGFYGISAGSQNSTAFFTRKLGYFYEDVHRFPLAYVYQLEWWKRAIKLEHEFIVAYIRSDGSPKETVIVLERNVDWEAPEVPTQVGDTSKKPVERATSSAPPTPNAPPTPPGRFGTPSKSG